MQYPGELSEPGMPVEDIALSRALHRNVIGSWSGMGTVFSNEGDH